METTGLQSRMDSILYLDLHSVDKDWHMGACGSGKWVPTVHRWVDYSCVRIIAVQIRLGWATNSNSEEKFWEHPQAWKRITLVLLGFFSMAFFMPIVGFFPISVLVMTFLIRLTGPQKLIKVFLTSIIFCAFIYLLFNYIFDIHLPRGPLPF